MLLFGFSIIALGCILYHCIMNRKSKKCFYKSWINIDQTGNNMSKTLPLHSFVAFVLIPVTSLAWQITFCPDLTCLCCHVINECCWCALWRCMSEMISGIAVVILRTFYVNVTSYLGCVCNGVFEMQTCQILVQAGHCEWPRARLHKINNITQLPHVISWCFRLGTSLQDWFVTKCGWMNAASKVILTFL